MTSAGSAERFRFDPVHDHLKPSVHLMPLQFLLGHFRGRGKYAMTSYTFHKELIGTPEAGGRFIALRMGVSYPLAMAEQTCTMLWSWSARRRRRIDSLPMPIPTPVSSGSIQSRELKLD